MATINEPITVSVAPLPGTSVEGLIRDAAEQLLRANDYERLSWICSHPVTPEDLLLFFCERGICLDDLGHRRGPRRLLERMAHVHRYPEVVLTLAAELFTNADESAGAFAEFAKEHADSQWMLESLSRLSASSPEKAASFDAVVRAHPAAEQILRIREVHRLESAARQATDTEEIERFFGTDEPNVLRALAGNPATPRPLLVKLAEIRNVKNAVDIRNRAQRTLDGR